MGYIVNHDPGPESIEYTTLFCRMPYAEWANQPEVTSMADSLRTYNQKRNFEATDEPYGERPEKRQPRLGFVVQHHLASHDHFDFRLEWDGVLKSWAVPKGPSYDPHDKRLAVQVEDHPLEYSTFEGTIPKGQYGGGVVMIWDAGEWVPEGDATEGLARGSLKFTLKGERLQGTWALVRMKPKPGEKNVNWLLIKEKDAYANVFDLSLLTTSSTSGRTMQEIEAGQEGPPRKHKAASGEPGEKKVKQSLSPAREEADAERSPEAVIITNPGKVLFKESGQTKGDVAAYYRTIAERMLPFAANRVLSVVRCPGGIDTSCFYKKHPVHDNRGIVAVPIAMKGGETEDYFYVPDAYGLLSEVQMNTLEFHTWGSRVETLEQPDIMVFDLDPDEGLDLERVRQGVRDLKSILDQLSLVSYLKTSGGKGYHVVVPFSPAAGWEAFHAFAHTVAKTMAASWPERYTDNVRMNRRTNRIFIDWIRNGRGATSVAPYSIRARDGAPVSLPISWDELATVTPGGITMLEAIRRLDRSDPWADFFDHDQRLK